MDYIHHDPHLDADMIATIRRITDAAGLDEVPFLDDAVRRLVEERDDALRGMLKAEKRCEKMRRQVDAARGDLGVALGFLREARPALVHFATLTDASEWEPVERARRLLAWVDSFLHPEGPGAEGGVR